MKKVLFSLSLAMVCAMGSFADSVADVRAFIEKQAADTKGGNFKATLENIPAAYRADFDMIANKFADKIDAGMWNDTVGLLDSIADAFGSKAEFFEDSLKQGDFANLSKEERINMLKGSSGFISALAKALTYERVKQPNVVEVLAEPKVAAAMMKLQNVPFIQQFSTNPKILDAKAVDNGVEVTYEFLKNKKSVVYTNVDGKWMDAEFVRNWPTYKGQALQWIDGLKMDDKFKNQFKSMVPMMKLAADQIKNAPDADTAQKGVAMMVLPFMMFGGNTAANVKVGDPKEAAK